MKRRSDFNDLSGQRFERLLVIKPMPRLGNTYQSIWHVRCDCGVEKFAVSYGSLMSGKTRSCGCLRKELASYRGPAKYYKHQSNTLYVIYRGMRNRCLDPKCAAYPNYGGRGITICQRWLDSFEAFVDDMGEKPSSEHSIDRINPDGNYEPENCRWATAIQQSQNRRPFARLIIFPWNGENLCVAEICRRENVSTDHVRKLLKKGHDIHDAVRLSRHQPYRELALSSIGDDSMARKKADDRVGTGKKLHKRHLIALGRLPSNEENERLKKDIWLRRCMENCKRSGITYRGELPSDLKNLTP